MNRPTTTRARPLALTIIGWWMVVTGVMQTLMILAYGNGMMQELWAQEGVNGNAAVIWSVMSGIGYVAAGTGVLRGSRWGRTVYLTVGLAGIVAGAVVLGGSLATSIFGVIFFGVFTWFLTRPEAEDYFSGTWEPTDGVVDTAVRTVQAREKNANDLQRVFGTIGAVVSGFILTMAFFLGGLFFTEGALAFLMSGTLFVPGVIGLVISTMLWGRHRWAGFVGWTLGVVGLSTAFSGISMMMVFDTEYWTAVSAEFQDQVVMNRQGSLVLSLIGILVLLAGTALVLRQRTRDARAAAAELERMADH